MKKKEKNKKKRRKKGEEGRKEGRNEKEQEGRMIFQTWSDCKEATKIQLGRSGCGTRVRSEEKGR